MSDGFVYDAGENKGERTAGYNPKQVMIPWTRR
jgi:hypothetical protein